MLDPSPGASKDRPSGYGAGERRTTMAKVRSGKRLGCWFMLAVGLLRPGLLALTRRDWKGTENLLAFHRAPCCNGG